MGGSGATFSGPVLQESIPVLRRLSSSVARDVRYTLRTLPPASDGGFDYSDTSQFTALNQPWAQLPLSQVEVLRVPDLPMYAGQTLRDAVLLGGPVAPGRGFVPQAVGLANNSAPADARLDIQQGLALPGMVRMRFAPAHHGLEGVPYVAAIWARSSRTMPSFFGNATAGLVLRLDGGPGFDPFGVAPLNLPAFTAMPQNGTWTQSMRRFAMVGTTFTTESALLVSFKASNNTRWTVVASPQSPIFVLPAAPGSFTDRTTGAKLRVETLRLERDQVPGMNVTWRALVEHDGLDLDDLLGNTVAFAIVEAP
jgi:hypothetical protein